MFPKSVLLLLAASASASPMLSDTLLQLESRQESCPNVHVFGARETTAPQGFGSSGPVVNMILTANPGATKEEIFYPATGGNTYASSAQAGVMAVTIQVTNFSSRCPDTQIVLVGYSQGAQIMDDAMCGGGDPSEQITNATAPVSASIASRVKAIILMGDPRHTPGAPYNIGNSTQAGFAPRPSGQICTAFASIIQSYCDAADPFCSKGNDPAVHQGYPKEYGSAALTFVQSKLSATGTNTTSSSSVSSSTPTPSSVISKANGGSSLAISREWGVVYLLSSVSLHYLIL